MIITTTSTIEGRPVREYRDLVFGEVIVGMDVFKDISASFRDFFGGRSKSYEKELIQARSAAMEEMKRRAAELGCNAVVGCKMDYEVLGASNGMLMVTISGTGVII